jgi:WD40 repeat protein
MIKAWDAESGRELKPFANLSGWGYALDYSPDGKVAACTVDNIVILYDAASGREIRQLSGYDDFSKSVAISADGKKIASGSITIRDGNNKIRIWDLETGRELLAIDAGKNIDVDSVSFNAGGKQIVAGLHYYSSGNGITDYHYIELYDAENGNDLGRLVGSSANSANSASVSADGKWIVTGSDDGAVRVWNAETRAEKARFIAFNDGEWLAMTPDGYYAASAKGDQYLNVRVGNTVTGIDRYRSAFNKPAVVTARLSNPARMTHNDMIRAVDVSSDAGRLASVSHDGTLKIWNLDSGLELRTIRGHQGRITGLSWSPDGRRLVSGAEDKLIKIWDADTGREIRTLSGHTDWVGSTRYSPDGRRIVSGADDKLIKIWDASDQGSATGREIRTLAGHTDMVNIVAWSPDGRRVASGSAKEDKTIRIWDVESGRLLQTLSGNGDSIFALAYSPDGKKIASSALEDKAVKIWDAETGRPIRSIPVEDNGGVYSLAWSPDGKRLATGAIYGGEDDYGNHIELWNAETGELIRTIWESGSILSLAFTPDGRRIVATSNFSDAWFIKVYDALTGAEL